MRAGYGIFYDGSIYSRMVTNMLDQPPFATASTLTTNPAAGVDPGGRLPRASPPTPFTTPMRPTAISAGLTRRPGTSAWRMKSFRNVILSVGYVGTKGTKLDLLLSPNSVNPSASGSQQTSIPGVQQFLYETSGAASIYNGAPGDLAAAVPRRLFHERQLHVVESRLTTRPAWGATGTTCRRTALICRRSAPFRISTFATSWWSITPTNFPSASSATS